MFEIYNATHESDDLFKLSKIDCNFFKFPAGEIHFNGGVKIKDYLSIRTDLSSPDEIMQLMLLADMYQDKDIYLNLLYTPYARQDRKTSDSEPFSLKTFARLINSCGFKEIIIYDPHSDVTPALINNVKVVKRLELIKKHFKEWNPYNAIIVSPDAGAMKANNEIAHHYKLPHISATKMRDIKTGEITAIQLHTDLSLKDKNLFIFDDICDGGRTFIELAKVLKKHNPASMHLYTTVSITQAGRNAVESYFDSVRFNHKLGNEL